MGGEPGPRGAGGGRDVRRVGGSIVDATLTPPLSPGEREERYMVDVALTPPLSRGERKKRIG